MNGIWRLDKLGRCIPQFQGSTASVSQLAASTVANGQFSVLAMDTNNPSQMFSWEVKAVQSDVPALEVVVPIVILASTSA